MILIELNRAGAVPTVRASKGPEIVRLGVAEAYRAGDPIPASVDEAAAYLREYCPTLWAFADAEAAETWAEDYEGHTAEALRLAVRAFSMSRYIGRAS